MGFYSFFRSIAYSTNTNNQSRNQQLLSEQEEVRKQAYEDFYVHFRPFFLQKMKKEYVMREEEAQDLYQESFLKMWTKSGEGIHFTTSPEAWIIQLAKGILFNQRKRPVEKNKENVYDFTHLETLLNKDEIAEIQADAQVLHNVLNRAASKICRDILSLAFLQDLGHEAIAIELGYSSADTVKTQKSRCLDKLRKWVNERNITLEDMTI